MVMDLIMGIVDIMVGIIAGILVVEVIQILRPSFNHVAHHRLGDAVAKPNSC